MFMEFKGKTLEDAIARGLAELGITRDEAEIKVIDEGVKGIFGIGSREAIIQIRKKTTYVQSDENIDKRIAEEVVEKKIKELYDTEEVFYDGVNFLNEILKRMGINDATFIKSYDGDGPVIQIKSEKGGLIIGKRGQTLNSLQHLVNVYLNKKYQKRIFYSLDISNYKEARTKSLQKLSQKLAKQVLIKKKNIELEPMNSRERRIIHMTLKNHPDVVTFSKGEEPYRKVVISLRKNRKIRNNFPRNRTYASS